MFTGIVEELGRVASREGPRLRIEAEVVTSDAGIGDSIAVNGTCLTVVALGDGWWEADVVDETLARTALGDLAPGDPVNLERPVRPTDRLGGHLVSGHVDGTGRVLDVRPDARAQRWRFSMPPELARYVARKGSICVDGVSLTVNDVDDAAFEVALVPHTVAHTAFSATAPGDPVNLEVDLVARYLERLRTTP